MQSMQTQADWIYNHQANIDQARLNDMYAQNAALRAQVAAMQTQHVAVNPGYVPSGIDPDLMYSQEYVNAAVNPTEVVYTQPAPVIHHHVSFLSVLLWLFLIVFIIVAILFLIAFLNWQSSN